MARVLAGESGGPDGLQFSARNATVSPADLKLQVKMDQSGSGVELRNKDNVKIFELDGRQLDELYGKNQLDVSRPEKLKHSIFKVWEHQRPGPKEPAMFVLDLRNLDPEQLRGRLKMLMDWLDEHIENDVAVNPHKEEPKPEPAPAPEQSAPPEGSQPAEQPAPEEPKPEPQVAPTGEPMPEKPQEEEEPKPKEEEQPNEQPKPKAGGSP